MNPPGVQIGVAGRPDPLRRQPSDTTADDPRANATTSNRFDEGLRFAFRPRVLAFASAPFGRCSVRSPRGARAAHATPAPASGKSPPSSWWVRSSSGPWSHSLPTTWPQSQHVIGWFMIGADVQYRPDTQDGSLPRLSDDGLRRDFLSRNRRRYSARSGPLDAAVELPGGCRRPAPARRSGALAGIAALERGLPWLTAQPASGGANGVPRHAPSGRRWVRICHVRIADSVARWR